MQLGNILLLYLQFSDNDECLVDNGGCPQSCNNTPGSYHCQCWNGYKMNNDSVCTGMHSRSLILNHPKLLLVTYIVRNTYWYFACIQVIDTAFSKLYII